MFQLSVVDHIRLSFGSAVAACERHADAAARLARRAWYAKLALLVFVGLAAAAALGAALRAGVLTVVAPCLGAAAFATCAAYLAIGPEARIRAHGSTAARLWLICEEWRALLAEIHDELIDVPAATARRDALLHAVATILEQAPPADGVTFDIMRTTLGGEGRTGYTDQELDQLLPVSLRRASRASA